MARASASTSVGSVGGSLRVVSEWAVWSFSDGPLCQLGNGLNSALNSVCPLEVPP